MRRSQHYDHKSLTCISGECMGPDAHSGRNVWRIFDGQRLTQGDTPGVEVSQVTLSITDRLS
jgi:hypothetical protein